MKKQRDVRVSQTNLPHSGRRVVGSVIEIKRIQMIKMSSKNMSATGIFFTIFQLQEFFLLGLIDNAWYAWFSALASRLPIL